MADYEAARAAIASIIAGAAIATPAMSLAKVYARRPDAGEGLNEWPCVLITGYTLRYLRGASNKRERIYTIGLRLGAKPVESSAEPIGDILMRFKEAISAAFDGKITLGLGGGYNVVEGPNWTSEEPEQDAGTMWEEGEIIVSLKDTAPFAA